MSKKRWSQWTPHIAVLGIVLFVTGLVLYKAYGPRPCERRRALFFIEAQGLRLDVSKLDICKKQILQQLATETLPLPELQKNFQQKGHWEVLTLERTLQALRKLRNTAMPHRPHDFSGLMMPEFHGLVNLEGFIDAARHMPELKLQIFLAPSRDTDAPASPFFDENLWPRQLYL